MDVLIYKSNQPFQTGQGNVAVFADVLPSWMLMLSMGWLFWLQWILNETV